MKNLELLMRDFPAGCAFVCGFLCAVLIFLIFLKQLETPKE